MKDRARLGVAVTLVYLSYVAETNGQGDWEAESRETQCGHDDWAGRASLVLGPQYFLEQKSQVQFSFGLEGIGRVMGPLLLGGSVGLGVLAETTLTAQAVIQVGIVRSCLLSLSLDLRGGVFVNFENQDRLVKSIFSGGMELRHDLEKNFTIQLRAGMGYLPGDNYGWSLDCALGLGFLW